MRVRLLCVGKPRDRDFIRLHDRYAERLGALGVSYTTGSVPEVRAGGRYSDDHVREREARHLIDALDDRGSVVALHAKGVAMTSERLAGELRRWATPSCTLIVGGPLGLDASVLERADHAWSLSPLTFPHELVRVIAAEQIYRAATILRGMPYHK